MAPGFILTDVDFKQGRMMYRRNTGTSEYYEVDCEVIDTSGVFHSARLVRTVTGTLAVELKQTPTSTFYASQIYFGGNVFNGSYFFVPDCVYSLRFAASSTSGRISLYDPWEENIYTQLAYANACTVIQTGSVYPTHNYNFSLTVLLDRTILMGPSYSRSISISYFTIQYLGQATLDISGDVAKINNHTTQEIEKATDSINGTIDKMNTDISNKIEESYDTSSSGELDSITNDYTNSVKGSLGVVAYVDSVFENLSGLMVGGSTGIVFPSVTIPIGESSYKLWDSFTWDFKELDGWLSGLMSVVRVATSIVVLGAVFQYLHKVWEEVFSS